METWADVCDALAKFDYAEEEKRKMMVMLDDIAIDNDFIENEREMALSCLESAKKAIEENEIDRAINFVKKSDEALQSIRAVVLFLDYKSKRKDSSFSQR